MASLHRQSVRSLNTSGDPKRFTLKTSTRKIQEIKVNVYRNLETRNDMPKKGIFMLDEPLKWRELDTTKDFMTFFVEMMALVQTSELVLYYKEKIFFELMSRINMKAHLSLESILDFLERFIDATVNILKDGGYNNREILEQVFTSWHHMIEYLQIYLIKNVGNFPNVTAPIRFFENYNVQDLIADAVSLLLRTLSKIGPSTELKKGTWLTLKQPGAMFRSLQESSVAAISVSSSP